ncbi:cobaltochelatase CobN [Devosia subaequoris]|uniref:Cobaltochelatase subunit CobN n=1 Tax=Devosia subaequoris TaxID=395930 RepID=A0A7W6NCX1_9HYPH|nr:cobaltochelatase subunit CobN [Devosia subaequoris]MBB4053204.1 cobaltochelatase CobN [Devosia subaequoris]MCP1210665.1 cobaltochelatase subunit CobN [Devosia subaequoris]
MHLLSAQAGAIQQEGEAIDLAQSPGDYVFASSADSELTMLAGAADRAGETGLRLANTLRLSNNLSVDMWLEQTVAHARLVVLRLIGGAAYFQYGVDELTALCANRNIPLVLLPGDANPDLLLRDRSTIHPDDWTSLHHLFIAGGPDNADAILEAFRTLAAASPLSLGARSAASPPGEGLSSVLQGKSLRWSDLREKGQESYARLDRGSAPHPFPRFGLWHPKTGMTDEAGLRATQERPPADSSPYQGEAGRGYFDATPHIPILFYRAALEGAGTATLEALIAELETRGLAPVPIVVSSLKEATCIAFVQQVFATFPPAAIFNLTAFALGVADLDEASNPFTGTDAPVIQLIQSGRSESQWAADPQGLSSKDMAMYLVMPEVDGRIGGLLVGHKADAVWHERTQCPLSAYAPDHGGISRAVDLAFNWARLRAASRAERKVAFVLANYPIRDGRLANGVGFDAPESTTRMLMAMDKAGYDLATATGVAAYPKSSSDLIACLQAGPTNASPQRGHSDAVLPVSRYMELFTALPVEIQEAVTARWGDPTTDPFIRNNAFHLPAHRFGNVTLMLQPARGYHLDETESYHDPALVPPHAYIAGYLWLRHEFGAHALIHNGKHGTLEWLPGKSAALDADCYPDALWGQLPHFYPFIVNDPGEGTQAKRRTGAVIIDHLVPPLTRAETYGPLKDLEALLDEYYAASGMDRRRLNDLKRRILDFTRDSRLDQDISLPEGETEALIKIDNFLCDLKEAQIRDGLHVFGASPAGGFARDLAVALARVPRGEAPGDNSLIRALADDLKLGFDPLTAKLGDPWTGPSLDAPTSMQGRVRRVGDMVEQLELIAADLVAGTRKCPPDWLATRAVLDTVETIIKPRLAASGPAEMQAFLEALDGRFIAPGPSGAPSRGRLDVLPTGRNFYSVDARAVPTPSAWELGRKSAESLVLRHLQDHGHHLAAVALSVWGTANMRTGGDDIAQALALIGARPTWDPGSLRVSGYEIIPLAKLGRPRVDVTLRISGFFRDAFPAQIALFDRAARAIGALDEPSEDNPIAARMRAEALGLMAEGKSEADASLEAGARIFGSKPGTYGAGLGQLIDNGNWTEKADLANQALAWGQYAYGAKAAGLPMRTRFAARLGQLDAIIHNQDNREHDLLDSDNYYQFEGGLSVAAETLSDRKPATYHNDHSRPEQPRIRTLDEEISHVMRSRVVNPKWIAGMQRHGYRGAFEIIATVDFMFAFAATTGAVKTHHFDLAFEAFVEDEVVRNWLIEANAYGYDELLAKFNDARQRGLWLPRSNSAYAFLSGEA